MSQRRDDGRDDGRDDDDGRHRGTSERLISNLFRKTRSTAQQTEDVLRSVIGELKLPKEVVSYILETVDGTRREIVRVAAREVREFLESANVTDEISRMLTTLTFEIRTEIRFVPNDQRLTPRARSHVAVRHGDETIAEEGDLLGAETTPGRDGRLTETVEELVRAGTTELTDFLQRLRRERAPLEPEESRAPARPAPPASPASATTSREAAAADSAAAGTRRAGDSSSGAARTTPATPSAQQAKPNASTPKGSAAPSANDSAGTTPARAKKRAGRSTAARKTE